MVNVQPVIINNRINNTPLLTFRMAAFINASNCQQHQLQQQKLHQWQLQQWLHQQTQPPPTESDGDTDMTVDTNNRPHTPDGPPPFIQADIDILTGRLCNTKI